MSRFLLVPGGWHGAWAYDEVLPGLRDRGHEADALTLSGLGPESAADGPVNLETHVEDVVRALESRPEPAILGAHSYGGMVIGAAAERAPHLVGGLVYLDAYVPLDGESCWALTTERFRQAMIRNAGEDGLTVRPSRSDHPRAHAQPLATLIQRVRLQAVGRPAVPRDFVYLSGWEGTPFADLYARLREDPGWHTHEFALGHNIALEHPGKLVSLLHEIAAREEGL